MVTKKLHMLEIAVGVESGVIYRKTGTNEMPRDVLTWQDISDRRIWVHSRETEGGYKPISIEVQNLGKERHPDGIDPFEAKARAALAAVVPADLTMSNLGHADIRNVPIGHVMHRNSILLAGEQTRLATKSERKLKLVQNEEYRIQKLQSPRARKPGTTPGQEIRATQADSILIAYIYVQYVQMGNKKPASSTSEMLGIETKFVYTALRNARKNGWVTTAGIGSSGGALTDKGKTVFEKLGRTRYEALLTKIIEENK